MPTLLHQLFFESAKQDANSPAIMHKKTPGVINSLSNSSINSHRLYKAFI
jgi:hypothetical protein